MSTQGTDTPQRSRGFTLFLVGLGTSLLAFIAYARVFFSFMQALINVPPGPDSVARAAEKLQGAAIPMIVLVAGAILAIVGLVQIFRAKRFYSENITVGGSYINHSSVGSYVSVHDVGGSLNQQLQQLASLNTNHARRVAQALDALRQTITACGEIPEDRKMQALPQLETLARVAQGKKTTFAQGQADTALRTINGLLAGLPVAAKTVASLNSLINSVAHLFALA